MSSQRVTVGHRFLTCSGDVSPACDFCREALGRKALCLYCEAIQRCWPGAPPPGGGVTRVQIEGAPT